MPRSGILSGWKGTMMRAILCKELGPAESLVVEDVPDPVPGPGEVLIDVHAAGLNFPDTLVITGRYQFRPELPFIPGGEASGVVAVLGEGVEHLKVGDRVVSAGIFGAFAEKICRSAKEVIPIPEEIPFDVGAGFLVTYGTSYFALKQRAKLQPGETLLVLGASGGVGMAAVDIGKSMGAKVIAAASSEEKLDIACQGGADMRINYSEQPLKEAVKKLTDGRGADVVYDPVGGDLSEQALRATAWDGRFLVIGFAAGTIPKIPLNLTLLKNNAIVGVHWGPWIQRDPKGNEQNLRELLGMIQSGKLQPLVTQTFKLEEYADAFATLTGRRALGKVILKIRDDQ
jgi:NADPH2:quinone reductase